MDSRNGVIHDPSLALYLPLWKRGGGLFISDDAHGHLFTATGAVWTPQGRSFDGIDDNLYGPTTALNSLPAATFLAWVFPRDLTGFKGDVGGKNIYQNSGFLLRCTQAGTPKVTAFVNDGGVKGGSGGTTLATGRWWLVGMRWKVPNVDVWLNGRPDGTVATNLTTTAASTNRVYLGEGIGDGAFADMIVGEAFVFDRALDGLEIQRLFLATKWRYQ